MSHIAAMLKSRRTFPPGGFQFLQPETGWEARPGATFDQVVNELVRHRKVNPRFNLSTDWDEVANAVDEYNCRRLKYEVHYCTGGPADPKTLPPQGLFRRASAAIAGGVARSTIGIKTLLSWLGDGGKPVPGYMAEARAAICAVCPLNATKDWKLHFTGAIARSIQKELALKLEMDLSTTQDSKLGICTGCDCYMPLKVWCPIAYIKETQTKEVALRLDKSCWVLKEMSA